MKNMLNVLDLLLGCPHEESFVSQGGGRMCLGCGAYRPRAGAPWVRPNLLLHLETVATEELPAFNALLDSAQKIAERAVSAANLLGSDAARLATLASQQAMAAIVEAITVPPRDVSLPGR